MANRSPQYIVGMDLGIEGGTAYTIGHIENGRFVVDRIAQSHQRTRQSFEKELEAQRRQRDIGVRKQWGKLLLIDLRAAKTTGAVQKQWQKAQLYLRTGREI